MKILKPLVFFFVLAWAVGVSVMHFYRNPLPFPDWGHRCFPVSSEQAAKVTVEILERLGGVPERFTFTSGETTQTLLADNTTVIIRYGEGLREKGLDTAALSVVTDDPKHAAQTAERMLRVRGFSAKVVEGVIPEVEDKLVVLTSNAFEGWALIFRRHLLSMGKPPKMTKLLDEDE